MSKLKQKAFSEAIIESNYLFTYKCKEYYTKEIELNALNVETGIEGTQNLKWGTSYKVSFAKLPNNRILCLRSSSGLAHLEIIQFKDSVLTKSINGLMTTYSWYYINSEILFWKDSAYIFSCAYKNDFRLMKYSLARNKLIKLAHIQLLIIPQTFSSYCICLEDNIVIGFDTKDLYIYDLYMNSYSILANAVSEGSKVFISGKERAYYIDSAGWAYESGIKSPFLWNAILKISYKIYKVQNAQWTYHNGCVFLRGLRAEKEGQYPEDSYVLFNLDTKAFHKKNITKACEVF